MEKRRISIFNSFQTKVTLTFVFSMLLVVGLGNYFLYEYSLKTQFNQLRNQLKIIARTAAFAIDTDTLIRIPLNKEGANSEEYKIIVSKLQKIKEANPSIKYIYTMSKTSQQNIWQFIADPDPQAAKSNPGSPTAYPGDKYDVSGFPEMQKAFLGPVVDKELSVDAWGATLSGYAPLYDSSGKAIAVLGVDMEAGRVYEIQTTVRQRALLLLLAAFLVSLLVGMWVSRRVAKPVKKLVEGTRKIASGDLEYKVKIKGKDEIGELAASFNDMADGLAESRKKLQDYFYRVVQAMVRSLEAKDHYTRGHSDRVSDYARGIALEMGFSPEKAALLKEAALLHDIGKLGIHEDILNKTAALNNDEWDVIHKHPEVGEEILKPVFLDDDLLSVIRSHHEKYDGTGYPDKLKGDRINILAQIVSVADSYDAMTSSRSYRPALSKEEAISRLKKDSGTQFNPEIVDAFVKLMQR